MTTTNVSRTYFEAFLRDHLSLCGDLIAGRPPAVSVVTIERHLRQIERKHGPEILGALHDRARAAVGEVYAGEPRPPYPRFGTDSFTLVEADIVAENVVKEFQQLPIRRATGADWRDRLNTRFQALIDRYEEHLDQRDAKREAELQAKAEAEAKAEAQAKAESEERAKAEAKAKADAEAKAAESTPHTRSAAEPIGMRYRGVWADDGVYRPGDMVTYRGTLWHAWKETVDKPGTSSVWQLMVKSAPAPKSPPEPK